MKKQWYWVMLVFAIAGGLGIWQHQIKAVSNETNTLFISPDGDDENSGSIGAPLASLEEAAERALPGTTVNIREGIYEEPLIIQHSGTAQAPIRFQAYENESVTISGQNFEDDQDDQSLISIEGHSYLTIDGLTLENLSTNHVDKTVIGILITGDSNHIMLSNNLIQSIETYAKDGNAHGIAVYGDEPIEAIEINKNTLTELKLGLSEALVVNGDVSDFSIKENQVYHTDNIAIDVIGYEGTALEDTQDRARNGVISENIIHHNSSYNNLSYNDYSAGGIYVDGGEDIIIEQNTIYQNDIGIEATSEHYGKSADNITIRNNEVYENTYTGISVGGYDSERGGTTNTSIVGNTLTGNDTADLEGGQLLFQHYVQSTDVQSNTMTPSNTGIFVSHTLTEEAAVTFKDNTYTPLPNIDSLWFWQGETFFSIEDFEEQTAN